MDSKEQPFNKLDHRGWNRMQPESDRFWEKAPKGYYNKKVEIPPLDKEFIKKVLPGMLRNDNRYLADHPEISTIICWILIQILKDKPKIDIRKKITSYFTRKPPGVIENEVRELFNRQKRHKQPLNFKDSPRAVSIDAGSLYFGSNITLIEAQKLSSRILLSKPPLKPAISEKSETYYSSQHSQPEESILESVLPELASIQDLSEFVFFVKAADIYNKFMKFSHIPTYK